MIRLVVLGGLLAVGGASLAGQQNRGGPNRSGDGA